MAQLAPRSWPVCPLPSSYLRPGSLTHSNPPLTSPRKSRSTSGAADCSTTTTTTRVSAATSSTGRRLRQPEIEMDIAEIAKKVNALEAELAAKSSRIDDLEAMVLLLETKNEYLRRKAVVSDGKEEGMAAVPAVLTPVKSAGRVATGQSDDEVKIMDAEERGEGDHGSIRFDANLCLEDEDVSITPRGKKRAAALVVSDSEDEDDGGHGNHDVGVTSSRKRALRGMTSDSESEEEDDCEPYEMKGCSTPATRRSPPRSIKSQPKGIRPARRALDLVEPKDHEECEDDSEEDETLGGFIVDDDCTENSADPAEESSAELEESDNKEHYEDIFEGENFEELMDSLRGKKNPNNKDWENEAEMQSAFDVYPELTLKVVCALYRKQTEEEKTQRFTIVHNKQGFSQIHAPRGSCIAEFLLDGDASGALKKTREDLKEDDREFCHKMALHYSKQLFGIYQNKEDPYFP